MRKSADKIKTIAVQNAEGEPETTAEILVQNKIDFAPKVSVIVPVYNVEKYLRACLDSVVNQTLREIEIVCVDDGSTDSSLEILKEFAVKDKRITVMRQKNLHAGVARNAGLAVAKGEYLSFLDSDDFFEPEMLEKMYEKAIKEKSQVVICPYRNYSEIDNRVEEGIYGTADKFRRKKVYSRQPQKLADSLFLLFTPTPWTKLFARELMMRENIRFQNLLACNDLFGVFSAIACAQKITFYNKPFVYYRYNRCGSLKNTRDRNPFDFYEAYRALYKMLSAKKLYDTYENAFLYSLISSSLWTLNHTAAAKTKLKKFIKEKLFDEFCLADKKVLPPAQKLLKKLRNALNVPETVISLTSYPARIGTVHQTIKTLLNQSIKANRVILWLAYEQFLNKEKDLPPQLLELTKSGLEIEWCHDIKSFKKLVPALKKYPESVIVTADDDILYPADWLERLLVSYVKNPQYIHCHRAHYVSFEKGQLKPYDKWYQCLAFSCISYNNFLTSGGGTLFPPHSLDRDVFDEEKFMRLCPQADDIWFWAMAVKNNTPIKVVENNVTKLTYVDGSQEQTLYYANVIQGGNNVQLKNVFGAYPEVLEKLAKNEVWEGCETISKYKLFGFIPLLKAKKRGGNSVWKVFGVPLVKIENK